MTTARPTILTAAPVGFTADGAVDLDASRRILEFIRDSGVDGSFVLGTTGEFPSLSREERRSLAGLSLEVLADRRVVVHVGAPSIHQVRELIDDARGAGARAVAVLTPYYLPASTTAVVDFFREAAAAAEGLDVFAYLFTARTGNAVGSDQLAQIAQIPGIIGAKVSGETLEHVASLRTSVPAYFQLLTGSDAEIARVTSRGIDGVISGVASVLPEPFVAVAEALSAGATDDELKSLQSGVDRAVELIRGDPERMKAGLAARGVDAGTSRMALDRPEPELADLVRSFSGLS
ncbi:dihydrodipicolinate synthase family protein [Brachybacterium halotolerans subsp. kimchii]|uniref:dihydrodipicolinate synthase family protein n=1 Tax=Brachybacterium halotolerans TaxID=2795215 RepID=UPI001E557177|nr:dihydrodipicolinate synthase family protein [Brachybacterium halotolerans]UEJ82049.1 dihydrodipicolinate synthase family protein [Brachybacterium halotolerans subsp. kimchii]